MNDKLILKEKLFTSQKGNIEIYDSLFEGNECYSVIHTIREHIELIDHDKRVIDSVINHAKRASLVITNTHGRDYFKFGNHKRYRSISLREYVYSKYEGHDSLKTAKSQRLMLIDDSLRNVNILDIRRANIYDAGGIVTDGFEIIEKPNNPSEKYIFINRNGVYSFQEYNEALFEFLATRNYCNISPNKREDRQKCVIHYNHSRSGYVVVNLSKAKLLFDLYSERYKTLRGFVGSFQSLNNTFEVNNKHCGHINAVSWNNCTNNIMSMDSSTNLQMRDFILDFVGMYDAFPIIYKKDGFEVILIELAIDDKITFWTCESPETYLDFQRVLLGKGMTANTNLLVNGIKANTPKQERKRIAETKELLTADMVKAEFWKWCDKRDNLIRLYEACPGAFKPWYPCETGNENFIPLIANIGTLANIDASNGIMVVSKLDAAG